MTGGSQSLVVGLNCRIYSSDKGRTLCPKRAETEKEQSYFCNFLLLQMPRNKGRIFGVNNQERLIYGIWVLLSVPFNGFIESAFDLERSEANEVTGKVNCKVKSAIDVLNEALEQFGGFSLADTTIL